MENVGFACDLKLEMRDREELSFCEREREYSIVEGGGVWKVKGMVEMRVEGVRSLNGHVRNGGVRSTD